MFRNASKEGFSNSKIEEEPSEFLSNQCENSAKIIYKLIYN